MGRARRSPVPSSSPPTNVAIPILSNERRWWCPECLATDITHESRPHTRFHQCPKLRGLTAPMVPVGTMAKMEIREREDYVSEEKVRLDPELGRPVMSIVTTRDYGQDVTVFAPTSVLRSEEQ